MPCSVIRSQVPESTNGRCACCIGQVCVWVWVSNGRIRIRVLSIGWRPLGTWPPSALMQRRGEIDSPNQGLPKNKIAY